MAIQLSVSVRNARVNAIETTVGGTALMKLLTGSQPADCATADSGGTVATLTLPADWMAAASGGSAVLSGTWQDTSADATGTIGYFRIYDQPGTTCHFQGSAGTGSEDLVLDNNVVSAGQQITITQFTYTDGNA